MSKKVTEPPYHGLPILLAPSLILATMSSVNLRGSSNGPL
ncbi:hypothetical protein XACM_3191 [Xanthomonas euvesicatoria pv. citrumelo F1]|nr:hypothetical protein XACM_3191 [Xanthomonas euvesicatoria pv. citrumelo F1]